jgi:probable rRNA maturation factor
VSDPVVDVRVEAGDWPEPDGWARLATQAVALAAAMADAPIADAAEVSLLLSDDAHIRRLNRDHRGLDKPTNVLSFPQADTDDEVYGPLIGDIVIAEETLTREAGEAGISVRDHYAHMVVHGFLHLIGYDHMDDAEAEEMEELETAILARMGIQNPYAEPV